MSSFKSNENIHKKEDGSYCVVSANKASSVTLKYCIQHIVFCFYKVLINAVVAKEHMLWK